MFKNYLKSTFRNLLKYKTISIINLVGLGIGMGFCLLVALYIQYEMSYDHFHEDSKNIFRVNMKFDTNGSDFGIVPDALAVTIPNAFPEVVASTRLWGLPVIINSDNQSFNENIAFVDNEFFDIFSFPLIQGDREFVFKEKRNIVITESVAKKYFGQSDPIGKMLTIKHQATTKDVVVSGIVAQPPHNSTIQFSHLLVYDCKSDFPIHENFIKGYGGFGINTSPSFFIKLDNYSVEPFSSKLTQFIKSNLSSIYTTGIGYYLQPLQQIYLNPNIWDYRDFGEMEKKPTNNPQSLYILLALSVVVLLLASVNYINLTIARSSMRFKEIGIRKMVGSDRLNIAYQIIFETMSFILLATIIGIGFVELIFPTFNSFMNVQLNLSIISQPRMIIYVLFLIIVMTMITASYPAIYYSCLIPANILKGRQKFGSKNYLSKVLISLQFTVSIGLLVIVLFMSKQIKYIHNKDLGFEKENLIAIPINSLDERELYEHYRNAVISDSKIINITFSDAVPGEFQRIETHFKTEGNSVESSLLATDHDFIKTMKAKLLSGRDFSRQLPQDIKKSVIVNELFVKEMRVSEPLGSTIQFWNGEDVKIIGVVKDFYLSTLKEKVCPIIITLEKAFSSRFYIVIRIQSEHMTETVDYLKDEWYNVAPQSPFDYFFMSDFIESKYSQEKRWNNLLNNSTYLALIIACMGLLGLSFFNINQRTKEIGIRKVLGASVPEILFLLTKDITKWVLLANLIAWPIAYYIVNKWLQNFAYHISVEWWVFILSGVSALIISMLTVSWQAIHAATANPVESLRYE